MKPVPEHQRPRWLPTIEEIYAHAARLRAKRQPPKTKYRQSHGMPRRLIYDTGKLMREIPQLQGILLLAESDRFERG